FPNHFSSKNHKKMLRMHLILNLFRGFPNLKTQNPNKRPPPPPLNESFSMISEAMIKNSIIYLIET
ncbi:hypothetical protein, partial [Vibrio cholerae]|uniref:hypothetical protein n=1 Tax=Vibrio cholerae TaxID=666 RepID=UPI001E5B016A